MNQTSIAENDTIVVRVGNQCITTMPDDLFIPPEALTVLLDQFSGPLDLLLYLIRKQNIDILDIPIVPITKQYLQYIACMQSKNLDLTAEYLLMAATLAEIKSRMLLPRQENIEEEESDPRVELVRRIQVYEQMKFAAESMNELPRCDRDIFPIQLRSEEMSAEKIWPELRLEDLMKVMRNLEKTLEHSSHHSIARETFSVRQRMQMILDRLANHSVLEFLSLINPEEGRGGMVVCFLAVLELSKLALLNIQQNGTFQCITLYGVHSERANT